MSNRPTPNASYSLTLRVKIQNSPGKLGEITTAIGRGGGDIEGIDIVSVGKDFLIRDITVNAASEAHDAEIVASTQNYESALIRITDLINNLIQIRERLEDSEENVHIDFEEILSQLTIIREDFEKKVIKTSAKIAGVQINNQLSKISDDLNRLSGRTIIVLEKDKDNE